jgi:site-specific DNA-methyltransferase (adenine-specific)
MPPLSSKEYNALRADIKANGVLVAIEFDEHGNVLDGHHRLKACQELGIIDYPRIVRAGLNEEEKLAHAQAVNIMRRQLSQKQRRFFIGEQLKKTPEYSNLSIARMLGVTDKTVNTVRREMEKNSEIPKIDKRKSADGTSRGRPVSVYNPNEKVKRILTQPQVVERMQKEDWSNPAYTRTKINKETKAIRKNVATPLTKADCKLLCADIRGGLPEIPDESVDVIITDPPYALKYIPLYRHLSRLAARVLKPGGSLLCMGGGAHFPEVVVALNDSTLRYHWTLCYTTTRTAAPLHWLRVSSYIKPIFWLTKGRYNGDLVSDLIHAPPMKDDKDYHEWGQSAEAFTQLVERFTDPGQVILDPFVGGGTTAVAAINTSRRFIGADIDPQCIEVTRQRVNTLFTIKER